MARRRRKKKGGRRKKTVPLLPLLPALVPASTTMKAMMGGTLTVAGAPEYFIWQTVGYSSSDEKWNQTIMTRQVGLALAGILGHKIANKTVNKYIPSWIGVKL